MGADSGTTWLSTNAENALLYASLLEGYIYMKGEADLISVYNDRYIQAMQRLKNLAEGENTTDDFRDDVLRIQRT